jgi:hypothetical protein
MLLLFLLFGAACAGSSGGAARAVARSGRGLHLTTPNLDARQGRDRLREEVTAQRRQRRCDVNKLARHATIVTAGRLSFNETNVAAA